MEFNWINLFGGIIVALMLIPNIVYGIKNKNKMVNNAPKFFTIIEMISRIVCIALMIFPLFVWEFGFSPKEFFVVYLGANIVLLISYYLCWIAYSKKVQTDSALALAIIPTLIFVVSGYLLKHWILVVFAAIFGASHIYITYVNHKEIQ